ncbi:MAG: septum formation protein [Rickettsiales bacterium]|jgi:septum formation protein
MSNKIKQNCQIILASSSRARKQILEDLGLKFQIISPDFDEEAAKPSIQNLSIAVQAMYLAKQKALSVSISNPSALTIGSDQICELAGISIDKSKDRQDAINQLALLEGETHIQNNAVCLYQGSKLLFKNSSKAKLTVRNLSNQEIETYVDLDQSWGCAGSYKFESFGKHLFEKVQGADNSIVGMNVLPLLNFLHQNKLISL